MIRQSLKFLPSLDPLYELASRCQNFDGYAPKFYWDLLKSRYDDPKALDFTYYLSPKRLTPIGLLSVYYFQDSVEIVAMVDPDFRRQGMFSLLLKKAFIFLDLLQTPSYLLVCHAKAESLNAKCAAKGGTLHHSEIEMQGPKQFAEAKEALPIILKPAGIADRETLFSLHQACFSRLSLETIEERINLMLLDPQQSTWLAKDLTGKPIGKLHAREDSNAIFLHDLSIIPELQDQGYGRSLIDHWYQKNPISSDKPVMIEVLGDNQQALRLYTSCGFTMTNHYHFWEFKRSGELVD